ncbi:MAG: amino acid-binding protein [Hyphomicrobiales bacterium]|nr:ACT domain-containing protein [Hyphomicrobiales bacterium]PCJ92744.1 MAG: amino acid-binding protein [Hyphomicrobiales bacterium]
MAPTVNLQQLPDEYAVCLLDPAAAIPTWVPCKQAAKTFINISYCEDELSIVCPSKHIPATPPKDIRIDAEWTAFKLGGTFAFDDAGVMLSFVRPLSENKLGVFVISTFHRDYLLLKNQDTAKATSYLESAGHTLSIL